MSELHDALRDLPVPDHRSDFWTRLESQLAPETTSGESPPRLADPDVDLTDPPVAVRQPHRGRRRAIAVAALAAACVAVVVGFDALSDDAAPPVTDITTTTTLDPTRPVVSPLVEMRSRLGEQSDVEMFSVSVDQQDRDYWRLMALSSYGGEVWTQRSDFGDATGSVDSDVDPSVPRRTTRQDITTTAALGTIYLPLAYELSAVVDTGGVALEYEVATGALVTTRGAERETALGLRYVVDSAVPDHDPANFPAVASDGATADFVDVHTALPVDWPDELTALAEQETAGATTDYERVRRLQDYFLSPAQFSYDPAVAASESVADLEDFLLRTRRGHAEQFATAFSALARALGIPSRVAVGFTPGDWDASREAFVVRGRHAHAWPEVYFGGSGWIPFDPTPGRGRPHDADVTGLAEAQSGSDGVSATPAAEFNEGVAPSVLDGTVSDIAEPVTLVDAPATVASLVGTEAALWASTPSGVLRIDPADGRILGTVETAGDHLIENQGTVWQTSNGEEGMRLSQLDPASDEAALEIETGVYGEIGFGGFFGPDVAAFGFGSVWLSGYDPELFAPDIHRIDASGAGGAPIGVDTAGTDFRPRAIAVGRDAVWVVINASVSRIDPGTNTVTSSTRIPTITPITELVAGDGEIWAITSYRIYRIDEASGEITEVLRVSSDIAIFCCDSVLVGDQIYLGGGQGVLYRFDTRSRTLDAAFAIPPTSHAPTSSYLAVAGDSLWFIHESADQLGRIALDAL